MSNAFQVVRDFERAVADYADAPHAVAVDSCSNALFLSLLWCKRVLDQANPSWADGRVTTLPCRTYPSVPCAVKHAGFNIIWRTFEWSGSYRLDPLPIVDSAKRFRRNMYRQAPGSLYCLSFHAKKHIPIGRGGMILTDDVEAARWLRLMRFDGREEKPLHLQESFDVCGYNFYMTPEQAARGLWLMASVKDSYPDLPEDPPFPDLSKMPAYR